MVNGKSVLPFQLFTLKKQNDPLPASVFYDSLLELVRKELNSRNVLVMYYYQTKEHFEGYCF